MQALETRDPEVLTEFLAEAVTHCADGSELLKAVKRPIEGPGQETRFVLSIAPDADVTVRPV